MSPFCVALFCTLVWSQVHGEHVSAARRRRGATSQTVLSSQTSERRCGRGRDTAPYNFTETEDGQGRGGGGARRARRPHGDRRHHLRGVRPGSLAEPGPQRSVRSLRRSSGETPLLGVPSLADPSAEASDGRTLRFLLTKALALQEKEEDEERRKVEEQEKLKTMTEEEEEKELEQARRELRTLLAVPAPRRTAEQETWVRACRSVIGAGHKRKRKKRRKTRLPRFPRPLLRGCARRRQRQWLGCHAGFPGGVTPSAILAGMDALIVDPGSGICKARIAGFTARSVFLGCRQARGQVGLELGWFTGVDAPRTVLLFFVVRPKMLGIMAGMTQVEICLKFMSVSSYIDRSCFGLSACPEVPVESCLFDMSGYTYKTEVHALHGMNKQGGFGGPLCAEPYGDEVQSIVKRLLADSDNDKSLAFNNFTDPCPELTKKNNWRR